MAKDKEYTNAPRQPDKSLLDVFRELGTAVSEGFRGSQRASEDPNKEAIRAQKRTQQRQGMMYGGKAKMMCGGKAKKK